MLKKLRLHNFRTFLNAEVSFQDRHLVIGRNNSGKTSLCSALRFLHATATRNLESSAQHVPGGLGELRNWALDNPVFELSISCEVPFDSEPCQYTYELHVKVEDGHRSGTVGASSLRVVKETLLVTCPGFNGVALLRNDGHEAHMLHEGSDEAFTPKTLAPRDATMLSILHELDTNRRAINFRRYLASWMYFSLNPDAMRYGWQKANTPPWGFRSDGGSLARILFQLKNMDEVRYRRVIEHVRIVEPDLEAINFIPTPDQAAVPFVALKNQPKASWNGLSDGTLRTLALASITEILCGISRPNEPTVSSLVTIEEPENGICPAQLRSFFDSLEDTPGVGQFLYTSHSPYFINFFDARRTAVTLLRRSNDRTEIESVPEPDDSDPDRPMLAEEYSMELFGT